METIISEGNFSDYQFEIWACQKNEYPKINRYYYKILDPVGLSQYWLGNPVIREANEYFESKSDARLAAIGHISLLEKGVVKWH